MKIACYLQKNNKVEILNYSDEFVVLHEEFAKKFWPDKRRRRIESYNRWKFRGPAKGTVNGHLLAVYENKIVGQIGAIPVELKNRDQIYDAQWICDLMVDSGHRGLGIGSRLIQTAMMRDKIITLGNNPSEKAQSVMEKKGFRQLKSGRTMIYPLNPEQILKWAVPEKAQKIIPLLRKIVQPYFSLKTNRSKKGNTDFQSCRWEDVTSRIDERQSDVRYPQIMHDKNFLEWRANGLENFSARIQAMKSPEGAYALYSPFDRYLDIYDWYCPGFDTLQKMLTSILLQAINYKSDMIQLVTNSEQEESWLKKLGFIRARSRETVLHFSKDKFIDKEDKIYFALFDTDRNL